MSFEDLTGTRISFRSRVGMRRNLGGFLAVVTGVLQMLTNLLAAWAGSVEIFLGIALDLRRTATPALNFVPKLRADGRSIRTGISAVANCWDWKRLCGL